MRRGEHVRESCCSTKRERRQREREGREREIGKRRTCERKLLFYKERESERARERDAEREREGRERETREKRASTATPQSTACMHACLRVWKTSVEDKTDVHTYP